MMVAKTLEKSSPEARHTIHFSELSVVAIVNEFEFRNVVQFSQ